MGEQCVAQIRKASAYEILVVTAGGVSASFNLVNPDSQSKVLTAAMVTPAGLISYDIGVILGGLLVVTGWALTERGLLSPRHSPVGGLLIERAGLMMLGPLLTAYAVAVWVASDNGAFAGGIALAVGGAHIMRAHRIRKDLIALRALAGEVDDTRATQL